MHKVNLKKPPVSLKFANFFGAFGYLSLLLSWLWVGGLLLYPLITSGKLNWMMPAASEPANPVIHAPQANGFTIVVGIVVTILCLILTVYALYFMPKAVGKTGAKVTRSAAQVIAPAVTQHKKVSKKKMRLLKFQISGGIKILLAIIPCAAALFIPTTELLSQQVIVAATLLLSAWALVNFAIQIIIAKANKLNTDQIW